MKIWQYHDDKSEVHMHLANYPAELLELADQMVSVTGRLAGTGRMAATSQLVPDLLIMVNSL